MNGTAVTDPIVAPIVASGLTVGIEDWQTIPESSSGSPAARINMLREVPDGSGRLFTNDLRGELWLLDGNKTTLFADLSALFSDFQDSPGLGAGFSSFAFHPEFATNGKFYTNHTEFLGSGTTDFPVVNGIYKATALEGVLTEWTLTDPTADVWSGTHREVLRMDLPGHIHGMQEIAFNPHADVGDEDYGLLYVGVGDGGQFRIGTGGDAAHRLDSLLGTIVRIDPLGNNSTNGQYGIPTSNPFVADGDPGTLGEIYAWGFRNPHRFTWDDVSGKVIVGEIGQDNIEELNLLVPGADYGWYHREGTFEVDLNDASVIYDLPSDDADFGYTYPVAMYDHDEGFAIVGGHVYRGSAIPALQGQYIFGDIVKGRIFHVPVDDLVQGSLATIYELSFVDRLGNPVTLPQMVGASRADVRFGLDADGEIYVLTKTDGKLRLLFDPADLGTVMVTSKDDVINTDNGDQSVDALGGHDIIRGGSGDDMFDGNTGSDTIDAGAGMDLVMGGGGEDILTGGADNDTLLGGNNNDSLEGGGGNDRLFGQLGKDTLDGGNGADLAEGGNANDLILGGFGKDTLLGQGGFDTLEGGAGNDSLDGGGGGDLMSGGDGADTLLGGAFNDTLHGGTGNDLMDGGTGLDVLFGDAGNDTLLGGTRKDELNGGDGNDSLDGGIAVDILNGDVGFDTLLGGAANDTLDGGADGDLVMGGSGSDLIFVRAGEGRDTLWGDAGNDVFDFETGFGVATINDFSGSDLIDLADVTAVSGFGDLAISYGADTLIDLGGGDQITLIGITGGLGAGDFGF